MVTETKTLLPTPVTQLVVGLQNLSTSEALPFNWHDREKEHCLGLDHCFQSRVVTLGMLQVFLAVELVPRWKSRRSNSLRAG